MAKTPHIVTAIERATAWVGSFPSLLLHTAIFIAFFALSFSGILSWDLMFLILTTLVSLEAIYLAIFIQFTVNRSAASLREVEEDIEEIQEDVEGLGKDVDEIQEDIEGMEEDDRADEKRKADQRATLGRLTDDVRRILDELEELKKAG